MNVTEPTDIVQSEMSDEENCQRAQEAGYLEILKRPVTVELIGVLKERFENEKKGRELWEMVLQKCKEKRKERSRKSWEIAYHACMVKKV